VGEEFRREVKKFFYQQAKGQMKIPSSALLFIFASF